MFRLKYIWRKISTYKPKRIFVIVFFIFLVSGVAAFLFLRQEIFPPAEYAVSSVAAIPPPAKKKAAHISTPVPVRGIYMTSWVAGTKDWREKLMKMIDDTELNSVVIDVKDYSGRISFEVSNPVLKEIGASEKRIPDIREFIQELHQRNIYVIARISVFQDAYLVKKRPDLAVKKKDGGVWKDYKGISWLNSASVEVWDYTIKISQEAESVGFDELNFDYIRYPSDGNMKDIVLLYADGASNKAESIRNFFAYLEKKLRPLKIPLSADLFGFVTTHTDDLNIGQILEYAEPYFDYICPMVYPSHYPPTYDGFKNPAAHPYEVIYHAMASSTQRMLAVSSTPSKLRPWLQDFDLGADYTAEMIRKEQQAVYDAGLDSWLLWDPTNKYTRGALD
ncbi:MAG: putative glycoside hydrolase [bacterium]|nr:putative glycoside hydrolase [bacterium]